MYYIKESAFIFIYEIMMSFVALACLMINSLWAKYVLTVACIIFYLFIIGYDMLQTGIKGAKQLHSNDLSRLQIIKTGQDIEFSTIEEYKPYKGFLIGFVSCTPMIVLLIIHSIIFVCGGNLTTFGAISSFIYMLFVSPFYVAIDQVFTMASHYFSLVGLGLTTIVSGLTYIIGAKRTWARYEKIEEQQKMIYGE